MASDIYSINNWAISTVYNKNAIVINGNYYYYSQEGHTSSSNFQTDLAAGKWGGILSLGGQTKSFFFWKPSYGYNFDIKPVVKNIRFGDGYSQIVPDGINNILLKINISFDDRDLDEHSAILHFLQVRGGSERFFYIPPAPYNIVKRFVCQEWSPSQSAYDKYSIKAVFEEQVV